MTLGEIFEEQLVQRMIPMRAAAVKNVDKLRRDVAGELSKCTNVKIKIILLSEEQNVPNELLAEVRKLISEAISQHL